METNIIHHGESLKKLKELPDKSIDMCVTSPPYWGLRDYGVEDQLGLEETPEEYVERLTTIFNEVKRVLKDKGTFWLNLGDTYNNSPCGGMGSTGDVGNLHESNYKATSQRKMIDDDKLKQKDLVGIPWRVAFALQEQGWYLRNDIIWHKPNAMPESVTDRLTTSHEHIFLLAKSKKYYYDQDAIREPLAKSSIKRLSQNIEQQTGSFRGHGGQKQNGPMKATGNIEKGKNKRDVWKVATKPFSEAHFAVYPPDLIRPCIKAGCPNDGIVLDPFMGAGTTALVALQENRKFVGIELNKEYIDIAYKRIGKLNKMYYNKIPAKKRPRQKQLI